MKKIFSIAIIGATLVSSTYGKILTNLSFGYYYYSEERIKDVIGPKSFQYGIGLGFELKNFSIISDLMYINDSGLTTYYKNKTDFKMIPININIRYSFLNKDLRPYIGIGLTFCSYKEKVYAEYYENISKSISGYNIELGFLYKIWKPFYANLVARYVFLKTINKEIEVDLGGFSLETGFAIKL